MGSPSILVVPRTSWSTAITVASEFEQLVPQAERPEHAEGREGFYHPIAIEGSSSDAKAHLHPA